MAYFLNLIYDMIYNCLIYGWFYFVTKALGVDFFFVFGINCLVPRKSGSSVDFICSLIYAKIFSIITNNYAMIV
jgi:hypothetical protein